MQRPTRSAGRSDEDAAFFRRLFKRVTGMTPAALPGAGLRALRHQVNVWFGLTLNADQHIRFVDLRTGEALSSGSRAMPASRRRPAANRVAVPLWLQGYQSRQDTNVR
jgi:hypothetical protein